MIRKAEKKDLEEVFAIIKFGKQKHQDEKIIQWNDFYPTKEHISQDIENNNAFLIVDETKNRIMGCISIVKENDYEYEFIHFPCFYVLHRMCVHPDYYNKGVAKSLLKFSEEYALNRNVNILVTDTNPENIMTNNLLIQAGFHRYDLKSNILKYLMTTVITKENEEWIEVGLNYNFYYKKLGDE